MRVLLFQCDGEMPNLALMRITAHHHALGNEVVLRHAGNLQAIEPHFGDQFDLVYASMIFKWSEVLVPRLNELYPGIKIGGTGIDREDDDPPLVTKLFQVGIFTHQTDYSLYPNYQHSIGFTQRGCRMTRTKCWFCGVPTREGRAAAEDTVMSIWRGDPYPKNLLLLDNDTFGSPNWKNEIAVIRDGGFKVCWNQGINARLINRDEFAESIASVDYRAKDFKVKRLYTAWDNTGDEKPLFEGLNRLVKYGVQPDHIMVYMLIGGRESAQEREYRRKKLRDFGCRPYPMPYRQRTDWEDVKSELLGFQRWVIGSYDKEGIRNHVSWPDWVAADYQPCNLRPYDCDQGDLFSA